MPNILNFKLPLHLVKDDEEPYSGPADVVPLYPDRDPNWSEAHNCFISELAPITDEQHREMDVADICKVVEGSIEDQTTDLQKMDDLIEDFVEIGELEHPYIQVARAYLALLEDDGSQGSVNVREQQMDYIKPMRNRTREGRLAHYVLLLDAEKHQVLDAGDRVAKALHEHGEDLLIQEQCQYVAQGNEFLEKLVEKHS